MSRLSAADVAGGAVAESSCQRHGTPIAFATQASDQITGSLHRQFQESDRRRSVFEREREARRPARLPFDDRAQRPSGAAGRELPVGSNRPKQLFRSKAKRKCPLLHGSGSKGDGLSSSASECHDFNKRGGAAVHAPEVDRGTRDTEVQADLFRACCGCGVPRKLLTMSQARAIKMVGEWAEAFSARLAIH